MFEKETVAAFADVLKQVGFPIVAACWFMFRTDKRIDAMRASLDALTISLGGRPPKQKKDRED